VLVVVALGAVGAALALYLALERGGIGTVPLAMLRAAAWVTVAALLVDPGCGRGAGAPPVVLLDHSLSMSYPGDTAGGGARWRAALDTARAIAGRTGRIILFGTAPVPFRGAARPDAMATRLLPAWREAASFGGPVAVVTDGEVDDARDLPADFLRAARVVVVPRPARPDVGIAGFELPLSLRAGDTATAVITIVAAGAAPADTATVELLEGSRVVARTRAAVGRGGGGTLRRELRFVPAAVRESREVRRYEARLSGVRDDAEPRDDGRVSVAEVTRGSTIALFSDSPDWDFRALAAALARTSGVPVRAFVHVAAGPWREAGKLGPVPQRAVDDAARGAALVVVHGTAAGVAPILALARHGVWSWTVGRAPVTPGDWYVAPGGAASPLGAVLAGVPPDSLPPLEALWAAPGDTTGWTGLVAQLARRGRERAVIVGSAAGGRRTVRVLGSGLWRWAGKGGVAAAGYAALVAAVTDWLLDEGPREGPALAARRDSLSRGLDELLPRPQTIRGQTGSPVAAAGQREPLRREPWVYALAVAALLLEWIGRRRRGLR
jgi:hypothetical protein